MSMRTQIYFTFSLFSNGCWSLMIVTSGQLAKHYLLNKSSSSTFTTLFIALSFHMQTLERTFVLLFLIDFASQDNGHKTLD